MNPKENFLQAANLIVQAAISAIPPADKKDIYALSFWYYNEDDDPRYPKIVIGYNTNSYYESQIEEASSATEARWNYAFWPQNEIAVIGGEDDALLGAWFRQTPHYYSNAEDQKAEENEALFDTLSTQGSTFDKEFIEGLIALTQQLFSEGFVAAEFGNEIPILLHELEYYEVPLDWTVRANPPGVADEFVVACNSGAL